jgi:3-oxoadipate enol-lactonase
MSKRRVPLPVITYDAPDDQPALVLGPSLGTSYQVWAAQQPAFRDDFRILHFELPGHGGHASASWDPFSSFDDLGEQVLETLDGAGVESCAYFGVSLGGMLGMWLAANAPDLIETLGLVCTSAYLPPAEGWWTRAGLVKSSGMEPIIEASLGRWFTPEFTERSPEVAAEFAAELRQVDPAGYAACCLAIADMDLRADLARIEAPTLVISGGRDPSTPPEHGGIIADGIAGARLLVVEDAAHLANVSSPEVVTAALLEHLRVTMLKR